MELLIHKPIAAGGSRNHGAGSTTKSCSSVAAAVGMVIGGRAARACDVCGKERARWFCAADEAYLCERCDGSIHSANAVAKRHERVRLRPNGQPATAAAPGVKTPISDNSNPNNIYSASRKRPRSIRRHNTNPTQLTHRLKLHLKPNFEANPPAAGNNNSAALFNPAKVKTEPCSGVISSSSFEEIHGDHVTVPDFQSSSFLDSLLTDCGELQDDAIFDLHEVPIYMPLDNYPELHPNSADESDAKMSDQHRIDSNKSLVEAPAPSSVITTDSGSCSFVKHHNSIVEQSSYASADESLEFFVPGNHIDIENFLDADDDDLCDIDVDGIHELYSEMGAEPPKGSGLNDSLNGSAEEYGDSHAELCFDDSESSRKSWLCSDTKVKVEVQEVSGELNSGDGNHEMQLFDDMNIMMDMQDDHDHDQYYQNQGLIRKINNLGLSLDLDDVVNAWVGKGPFWVEGQRPDESTLHTLEGWLHSSCGLMNGDHQHVQAMLINSNENNTRASVVIKGGAREARVMRYREKRRTRLFSKKIRYEVRKLNAEKRPRMKGRFVKRTPSTTDTQQ